MTLDKIIVLAIFIAQFALVLSRVMKISYIALGAAALLMALGYLKPADALFRAIHWDVLGIYWGFMMVSDLFMRSGMPALLAHRILARVKTEREALMLLCVLTAFLSAFMHNVGVVLMIAPVAIATARHLKSSLFPYLVAIAISSNVVTTVTMIGDPPSIILALDTGMTFFDFYWFEGRIGLGTISAAAVVAAFWVLRFLFRDMKKPVHETVPPENVRAGASILFAAAVAALAFGPEFGLTPGWVGMAAGAAALWMGRKNAREMITSFDWDSFAFIIGIFMLVFTVDHMNLLRDFTNFVSGMGLTQPAWVLAFLTWVSVLFSGIIDNVPYTVLMIPVCREWADLIQISAWPLLYGMLIGTGIGGNITPVGATANVFACGILEKHGYKIRLWDFVKIGLPFSVAAVAVAHILVQWIWLRP